MSNKIRHIYYLCPDNNTPSGGVHKIYDHVEILNAMGYSAFVLHDTFGFRCDWFKNTVPCVYPILSFFETCKKNIDQTKKRLLRRPQNGCMTWKKGMRLETQDKTPLPPVSEADIIVIPEYVAQEYNSQKMELPFVIFNQNSYLSFNNLSLPQNGFKEAYEHHLSIYKSKNLLGVMTVSEDNTNYLKFVYPQVTFIRMRNAINPSVFYFGQHKKNRIVFMPRKMPLDALQVINILKERNILNNWEFYAIDNVTESQVSEILRESAIFLSCIYHEGCPLPPAEAIACGCIVIGYHGQGGREYLRPPYAHVVETGNIISFAKEVERIALDYTSNPQKYLKDTQEGSKFILQTYSPQFEKEDIANAWRIFQDAMSL